MAITLPRVFPKNFLISPRSMAEELARDGGHELNTEFQYTSWINPTFLSDQPFLPPPFIYPAAFESIVAVSICPVILAVYHDYTGGRTGSIHRHRPSKYTYQARRVLCTPLAKQWSIPPFLSPPLSPPLTFLILLMHCQRIPQRAIFHFSIRFREDDPRFSKGRSPVRVKGIEIRRSGFFSLSFSL